MGKPASGILTRTKVLWLPDTDSHNEIIERHYLNDSSTSPDFVRFEITPPGFKYSLPPDQWVYRTAQDYLPDWYDQREAEIAVRDTLHEWISTHIIRKGTEVVRQGEGMIFLDYAIGIIRGGRARFLDQSIAIIYGGEVWLYDNVHCVIYGNNATIHDERHK